jgi:hypothetical protein
VERQAFFMVLHAVGGCVRSKADTTLGDIYGRQHTKQSCCLIGCICARILVYGRWWFAGLLVRSSKSWSRGKDLKRLAEIVCAAFRAKSVSGVRELWTRLWCAASQQHPAPAPYCASTPADCDGSRVGGSRWAGVPTARQCTRCGCRRRQSIRFMFTCVKVETYQRQCAAPQAVPSNQARTVGP